ncbi:unnamed protein product, partial [Didymodactylos carnosus]
LGMLAVRYTDDAERGRAIGIGMGGLALGILVLRLTIIAPPDSIKQTQQNDTPITTLLQDPYILIALGHNPRNDP